MKKTYIGWVTLSFAIMLVLPWVAVTLVKGDAGMAVCFLLFYAINPIYSAVVGYFSGKSIKKMWSLPVICAVAYLLGTWLFFDMGESAFIIYAGMYLVIGAVVMSLTALVGKRARQ